MERVVTHLWLPSFAFCGWDEHHDRAGVSVSSHPPTLPGVFSLLITHTMRKGTASRLFLFCVYCTLWFYGVNCVFQWRVFYNFDGIYLCTNMSHRTCHGYFHWLLKLLEPPWHGIYYTYGFNNRNVLLSDSLEVGSQKRRSMQGGCEGLCPMPFYQVLGSTDILGWVERLPWKVGGGSLYCTSLYLSISTSNSYWVCACVRMRRPVNKAGYFFLLLFILFCETNAHTEPGFWLDWLATGGWGSLSLLLLCACA